MNESILDSVKKLLGIPEDYDVYDLDIVLYINGVFSRLAQLGLGPSNGFSIENSSAVWASFLGGDRLLNNVKTYMVLKVRLLFDPPTTSFAIAAIENQIKELEWLINSTREEFGWTDPMPIPVIEEEV